MNAKCHYSVKRGVRLWNITCGIAFEHSSGNGMVFYICNFLNSDKTKYMIMSRDQNAGRSYSMKTDNTSSTERVEEF